MNEQTTRHIELLETAAQYVIKELNLIDKETAKQVLNLAAKIKLHAFEEVSHTYSTMMSGPEHQLVFDFLKDTASLLKIFLMPSWNEIVSVFSDSGVNTGLVIPKEGKPGSLTTAVNAPETAFKAELIQQCQWIIPLILIRLNAQTVAEELANAGEEAAS